MILVCIVIHKLFKTCKKCHDRRYLTGADRFDQFFCPQPNTKWIVKYPFQWQSCHLLSISSAKFLQYLSLPKLINLYLSFIFQIGRGQCWLPKFLLCNAHWESALVVASQLSIILLFGKTLFWQYLDENSMDFHSVKNTQNTSVCIHSPNFNLQYWVGWLMATHVPIVQWWHISALINIQSKNSSTTHLVSTKMNKWMCIKILIIFWRLPIRYFSVFCTS